MRDKGKAWLRQLPDPKIKTYVHQMPFWHVESFSHPTPQPSTFLQQHSHRGQQARLAPDQKTIQNYYAYTIPRPGAFSRAHPVEIVLCFIEDG